MPAAAIDAIWSPLHLERLARTYWRFLSRCTLGLVRVDYTDDARYVVFIRRPFVLLAFRKPEYEMDDDARRRAVAHRARRARRADRAWRGRLPRDRPPPQPGRCAGDVDLHVEVEVANYYPRIAFALTQWALRGHAVAHPRDRDLRLPALGREAEPGALEGRSLRSEAPRSGDRGRARSRRTAAERARTPAARRSVRRRRLERSAVALAGDRAQLLAIVASLDAPHCPVRERMTIDSVEAVPRPS